MATLTEPRASLDGERDRQRIFAGHASFDHRGLAPGQLAEQTMGLLQVPGVATPEDLLSWFRKHVADSEPRPPAAPQLGLSGADELLAHRFTFYDESYQLPEQIDFTHNPGTAHWAHDLNRFSYLGPLVAAWQARGDQRYADKALDLILQWIDRHDVTDAFPPGRVPYVFASYLNIAIHLVPWSRTIRELAELLDATTLLRILKSVHDQLQYLDYVIPEARNNWVAIGTRGQLVTMAALPCFRAAPELATCAYARLLENVEATVDPEGVQTELTPLYHGVSTRELADALDAAHQLPVDPPERLNDYLRMMLLYLRHTVTPDGHQLAFNDSDSDPERANLCRQLLARPLSRELLGPEADRPLRSHCWRHAGVMIMRQGQTVGPDEAYLAFDGGPYGLSHQHEDKLSFWLTAFGRTFIVDPGRHLYDGSERSWRSYLISTEAHSTICIDGRGQHSKAFPDQYVGREPQPILWEESADGTIRAGASYELGYGEELIPVVHRRTFIFHPDGPWWELVDELSGEGCHDIDAYFQFMPGELTIHDRMVTTAYPDSNLAIAFEADAWDEVRIDCGRQRPRAGWYSERYGKLEPAPRLNFRAVGRTLPCTFRYRLIPYRGPNPPPHLQEASPA